MTEGVETDGLGAVVLAAGACRWLGPSEPLRHRRGEPLVRRLAQAAVEAGLWPVVVVVGARAEEVRAALAGLPVATVERGAGPEGALRRGLERLGECAPGLAGAVILGCDPPSVDARHLAALAAALRATGRPVAATAGAGAAGLPALFAAALFPALLALERDRDVLAFLAGDAGRVAPVPLRRPGAPGEGDG